MSDDGPFTNDQLRAAFGKSRATIDTQSEVEIMTQHHGKFWSSNGISFTRGRSRLPETDLVTMSFMIASVAGNPGSRLVPALPMLRALYAQYADLVVIKAPEESQSVDLDEVARQWQEVDHALEAE